MKLAFKKLGIVLLTSLVVSRGSAADIDEVLKKLYRSEISISAVFVASIEREIRSVQGTDVERGNLDWGIIGTNGERLEILSGISAKELRAVSASALDAFCRYSSESELRLKSTYVHNPNYDAIVIYNQDVTSWSIDTYMQNSKFKYDIPPLQGLVAMMPYRWSVKKLMDCNGAKLIACTTSTSNPNLINVQFKLNMTNSMSPFKEAFQGTWTMNFDQKLGYIVTQQFIADNRMDTCSYEYQFKEGEEFPTKLVKISEFEFEGKAKKENHYEFLKVSTTHSLPKEAAYLPFYGLPDPSTDVSRFFRFGNAWVLGLFFLLLGLVIFRLANRKK